jgi:hypothetical protein
MDKRTVISAVLLGALALAACSNSAHRRGGAVPDPNSPSYVPFIPGDTGAGSSTQSGSAPTAPHNCESDATC